MEARPRIHVLAVDDDPLALAVLKRMLLRCQYQVTTCMRAAAAVQLLRKYPDTFDLVMSDVYMPDVDGFKLLEAVGLEMGLPVIMMSANGETSVVMRGITHGACDYLIKPIRMEELKTIWQHVVRRKGTQDTPMMRSQEAQLVKGVSTAVTVQDQQRMPADGARELGGLGLIDNSGSNPFSHVHSTRGNAGIKHRAAARSGSFGSSSASGSMGGSGGGGGGLFKMGSLDIGLLLKMQQEEE